MVWELAIHKSDGSEADKIEVGVGANVCVGSEGSGRLLRDVDITQRLKLELSGLATDIEPNGACANLAECGRITIVIPTNSARLTSLASGASNWGSDVEFGKRLRDKGSSSDKGSYED